MHSVNVFRSFGKHHHRHQGGLAILGVHFICFIVQIASIKIIGFHTSNSFLH